MSTDMIATADSTNPEQAGTRISRFLANRGVIIIKEIREIGSMRCEHQAKLKAATMILATAKSSTRVSEKDPGIRLEAIDHREDEESAHLDFDESEELSKAITFIHEAAQRIAGEKRDYTESAFGTKDEIAIGFYQDVDQAQSAFNRLSRHAKSCFLEIGSLPMLKKLVEGARAHLIKKGAGGIEGQTG